VPDGKERGYDAENVRRVELVGVRPEHGVVVCMIQPRHVLGQVGQDGTPVGVWPAVPVAVRHTGTQRIKRGVLVVSEFRTS